MKIRPVAAELFHAMDGRSDKHDEANSVVVFFSQFCKCTENCFAPVANRTIRTEILMSDIQHLTALRLAGRMFGPRLWYYSIM